MLKMIQYIVLYLVNLSICNSIPNIRCHLYCMPRSVDPFYIVSYFLDIQHLEYYQEKCIVPLCVRCKGVENNV